jgi:hypothetical protein
MVSVNFRPDKGFKPTAVVMGSFGGLFVAMELEPGVIVYSPGTGEESAVYVRQLALVLAQAADQLETSIAREKAAERREANAYAEASAAQATDAMLGRAV